MTATKPEKTLTKGTSDWNQWVEGQKPKPEPQKRQCPRCIGDQLLDDYLGWRHADRGKAIIDDNIDELACLRRRHGTLVRAAKEFDHVVDSDDAFVAIDALREVLKRETL